VRGRGVRRKIDWTGLPGSGSEFWVPGVLDVVPLALFETGCQHAGEIELARDDLIQATGSVDKILGGGRYQITLESGQAVTAQLSGRMRRFRIRVIPGDRVTVGLSPYDPTHGFITFRLREGQAGPGPGQS